MTDDEDDHEKSGILWGPGAILALADVANKRALIRNSQMVRLGVQACHRIAAEKFGSIRRVSRGVYTGPDTTDWQTSWIAQLSVKQPRATFALHTALMLHGLMELDLGAPVWAATGRRSRLPRLEFPAHWVRWSSKRHEVGIEKVVREGLTLYVTTPARTVADYFAHRKRLDPGAPEAALALLRDSAFWDVEELLSCARLCRVYKPLRATLESAWFTRPA